MTMTPDNTLTALCELTPDQYTQMQRTPDRDSRPRLFALTHGEGRPIFEDDITVIARDAVLATIDLDSELADRLAQVHRDDADPSPLPLETKLAVIRAAQEHWQPPLQSAHNYEDSYWRGPDTEARALLGAHPALMDLLPAAD